MNTLAGTFVALQHAKQIRPVMKGTLSVE